MSSETPEEPLFANVDDTDPALIEAVNEARRTISRFLEVVSKNQFSPATYLVKVPLIDRSETMQPALVCTAEAWQVNYSRPICRLWLSVTQVFGNLIFCAVLEAPDALHLDKDAAFVVESASVEDWMIIQNEFAFGGFSLRVIRSRLSKNEQLKFDAHTGIRGFKALPPQ